MISSLDSSAGKRRNKNTMRRRGGDKLSTEIVRELKARIFQWEYSPGHRFTEQGLCAEFKVSRSPVREALRVLAENGIIESIPRRGFRVRLFDLQEVYDLYEIRMALELYAVEELVKRRPPPEALEDLARPWRGAALGSNKTEEELAIIDRGFHEDICALTGNQTMASYLKGINERLLLFRVIDFGVPERVTSTCEEHLNILEALGGDDIDLARESMRKHITVAHNNVEDSIRSILMKAYLNKKNYL